MPSANSLVGVGLEFQSQGDLEAAQLHFLAALKLEPDSVQAIANLAVVMAEMNRLDGAAALGRRLVDLAPYNGNFWELLGNFLTRLDRLSEAEFAFARAIELSPEAPNIHHNQALCFLRQRKYLESIASFNRAELLGTTSHGLKNDKAHAFMALGDLSSGWELYESRWATLVHLPPWDYHIPEWKGEDLTGKRILIHAEQGLGDTIMCVRFFLDLRRDSKAKDVVLGIPKTLQRLFDLQNVNTLAIEDMNEENMEGFDFQSPMYSAMRYLGINSPQQVSPKPYLKVLEPRKFSSAPNIGLCWASGKRGIELDSRRREADLKLFLPLIENHPKARIWSLQKGTNEEDISNLGLEALIQDETGTFSDFYETAKFVSRLDLVITVDTAIAHLSGALGIPTLMLAQYSNCWRWWNIESGSGEPWYSGMRIFRQPVPGDWKTPIKWAINNVSLVLVARKIAA